MNKKIHTALLILVGFVATQGSLAQQVYMMPYATLSHGGKDVKVMGFSTDDHLITSNQKGAIKVWDLGTKQVVSQHSPKKQVVFADFISDNQQIITVQSTGATSVYSRDFADEVATYKLSSTPLKVSLDPNKHYLSAFLKDKKVEIIDLKANMLLGKIPTGNNFKAMKYLGFDRFSHQLAGISSLGKAINWNPYRQQQIRELKLSVGEHHGARSVIHSVSSNSGSDLYIAGIQEVFIPKGGMRGGSFQQPERRNQLIAYNWHDGREVKRIKINETPSQVALGPGTDHVAYISKGKRSATMVCISRGEQDSRVSLNSDPTSIAIAETNDYLAVSTADGNVSVYTLERNQTALIKVTKPAISRSYAVSEVKEPTVHIAGVIENHRKVIKVKVNGRSSSYDATGNFSTEVPLRAGKNKVSIVAEDTEGKQLRKDIFVNRIGTPQDEHPSKKVVPHTKLIKKALVIGNSNYAHTSLLKNPKNDAIAMSQLLRELGFEVIEVEDGSYDQMKEAVYRFGDAMTDADVTIFYYAGHGIEIDGANYLIPIDAELNSALDVKLRSIPLKGVINTMEYANDEGLNMMILDACRNNPFPTGKRGGAGLAKVSPPSGTLIAYATDPGSTASDGTGSNGLYTGELIKQMRKPQRIVDVFRNTRVQVEQLSGGNQRPWEEARLKGIFYLKSK